MKFWEELRNKVNFDDETLIWFNKFTPKNVISGRTSSIVPLLIKMFPHERKNYDSINNQFRSLADIEYIKTLENENITTFWSKVALMKNELNEYMFSDISRIVKGILSIPHSSANIERIFSYQNIIKSKERNRLYVSTVSSLIQTKDLLNSNKSCCFNFELTKNLLNRNLPKD